MSAHADNPATTARPPVPVAPSTSHTASASGSAGPPATATETSSSTESAATMSLANTVVDGLMARIRQEQVTAAQPLAAVSQASGGPPPATTGTAGAEVALGSLPPASALPPLSSVVGSLGSLGVPSAHNTMASSLSGSTASSTATATSGLLQLLFLQREESVAKRARVWIGDGLPTVPKKLVERIQKWDYVNLGELRPMGTIEKLNPEPDPFKFVIMPGLEVARARKKPIVEIGQWIECFAIYMAVVSQKFPTSTPELLAYMLTTMRAQREYEEPAWRVYDQAYHDKAAATGNRKWSQVDTHLFNQIFTGRARQTALCGHCGVAGHAGDACPSSGATSTKKVAVSAAPFHGMQPKSVGAQGTKRGSDDICWSFNKPQSGVCRFGTLCKFRHMCVACSGRHPEAVCEKKMVK